MESPRVDGSGNVKCFRPLVREASIAFYRWARHDLQRKDPGHPDLPGIIVRLRDLRAERRTQPSIVKAAVRWL